MVRCLLACLLSSLDLSDFALLMKSEEPLEDFVQLVFARERCHKLLRLHLFIVLLHDILVFVVGDEAFDALDISIFEIAELR